MKMLSRSVGLFALALCLVSYANFCAAQTMSQTAPFSIEQILSAPFPTELIAAPAKNRLAWEFDAQGRRNIWIAEPAPDGRYVLRQITSYTLDDGQDIGDFAFTPDANSFVYVRGGDFEHTQRENPNPSAITTGVEQDIYVVPVTGGEPRNLAEGHGPAISPEGDAIAYLLKGEIWLANLDGSGKPQQLMHEMGRSNSLRWSPDGQSLAFVSSRANHSFIGVYSLATKSVIYLDPSTDQDQEPVWSPDGTKLAFLRIPSRTEPDYETALRTTPPWSIRVADVATKKGREIWRATDGSGSVFREIVADNQLLWGDGDRIIFPWEHDGWTHLYSVPLSGGSSIISMTPGNFEVENVSLSRDRKTIVFSSNQDDIDRRHVWKVTVGDTHPAEITSGGGIETAPVFTSDNQTVALLHSDARVPMRPAIVGKKNEMLDLAADQIPKDFPSSQLVVPQQVIFSASDRMPIHGQVFLPRNAGDGARHPAIVFVHGGSRREMLLGWHYMSYYSNAYALNQYFASRGYIVLSVNYRSGIGYGLNFREALNFGPGGASEYNDVLGAGTYLRSRADVDAKRIGIWGGSYGGYLTALALARNSDVFAAGVDLQGVHNWASDHPEWANANPGASPPPADVARLAWQSSPAASIGKWRSPVLLIQGDDDRNVQFSQMIELAEALRKQGVDYEELVFPDEIHDFLLYKNWLAAYSAGADFFRRHLGK